MKSICLAVLASFSLLGCGAGDGAWSQSQQLEKVRVESRRDGGTLQRSATVHDDSHASEASKADVEQAIVACCQQRAGLVTGLTSERKADGRSGEVARRRDGGARGGTEGSRDGGTEVVARSRHPGEGDGGSEAGAASGDEASGRQDGGVAAERDAGEEARRDGGESSSHEGEVRSDEGRDGGVTAGEAEQRRDGGPGEGHDAEAARDGGHDRADNVGQCVSAGKAARRAGALDAWMGAMCSAPAPAPAADGGVEAAPSPSAPAPAPAADGGVEAAPSPAAPAPAPAADGGSSGDSGATPVDPTSGT